MRVVTVADAQSLQVLGARVGARLFPGAVVLVNGELGAGKTTFAQGVARGLGVGAGVVSPTYALVLEYPEARIPFSHADVYRMDAASELISAGIDERIGADGVWLVEWASRFPQAWPAGRLEVRISESGEGRRVELSATDVPHQRIVDAL